MNPALSLLLSSFLFVQAVLGCCWHCAHSCQRSEADGVLGPAVARGCKHHDCGCQHEHHRPCNCRIECQGVCVYLPTHKFQTEFLALADSFDHVPVISSSADIDVASSTAWEPLRFASVSQPTLPLHLLYQILLI